jgi:hypothetical protein
MDCEIELLPVGDGTKAGDAIVIRYGNVQAYELMIVDGGNLDSGKLLVEHVRKYFGKDAVISHVLLTHSDADHASGLREVLRELPVTNLWLHIPWLLAERARHLFKNKRFTEEGLRDAIKKEYNIISEIFELACVAKCKVYYPFQGSNIGPFCVLSPSPYAYQHLLPQFDKTPDPDREAIEAASMWLGKQSPFTKLLEKALAKVQKWAPESWNYERLKDGGVTTQAMKRAWSCSVILARSAGYCSRETRGLRALLGLLITPRSLDWHSEISCSCRFRIMVAAGMWALSS